MVKHTLSILRYEKRKIFEVSLAIFQHYVWKVNSTNFEQILPVGNLLRGSRPDMLFLLESFLYFK